MGRALNDGCERCELGKFEPSVGFGSGLGGAHRASLWSPDAYAPAIHSLSWAFWSFGLFDLAGSGQGEWLLLAASASNVRSGTASRTVPDRLLCTGGLHPSEDAVEVRSAHWTLGLSHPGALVV